MVAVILELLATFTLVRGSAPTMSTRFTSWKSVPVMVMVVPPEAGPEQHSRSSLQGAAGVRRCLQVRGSGDIRRVRVERIILSPGQQIEDSAPQPQHPPSDGRHDPWTWREPTRGLRSHQFDLRRP